MTKAEIAAKLADKVGISHRQSVEAVEIFLDSIKQALIEGDRVSLVGFGTFFVKERDERNGRNPRTGNSIFIPRKRIASFKPGKSLREIVKDLSPEEVSE